VRVGKIGCPVEGEEKKKIKRGDEGLAAGFR
jgi:hypothetical protein